MAQQRVEKIQEFIQQELSKIILNGLKDPRVGFVTVTGVEVTGDLRSAKVFVSLMGSEQQKKDTPYIYVKNTSKTLILSKTIKEIYLKLKQHKNT